MGKVINSLLSNAQSRKKSCLKPLPPSLAQVVLFKISFLSEGIYMVISCMAFHFRDTGMHEVGGIFKSLMVLEKIKDRWGEKWIKAEYTMIVMIVCFSNANEKLRETAFIRSIPGTFFQNKKDLLPLKILIPDICSLSLMAPGEVLWGFRILVYLTNF